MATLVTGGTGFVGANIVKELARRGHDVISLDVMPPDGLARHFLGHRYTNVTFYTGDILDPQRLDAIRASHSIDKIVHAAVFTVNRTDRETARSKEILDINLTGTGNLLELAREIGVQRFVYISSGAAYGLCRDPDQTYNEDDHPQPANLYGITKLASEQLTQRYGHLHGFSTASLRVSTPYGPMERITGHRDNMSTPYQWTGAMLRGEPITRDTTDYGRDYTYVLDTGSAIAAVVDAEELPHHLYNITNGVSVTGAQIQITLAELFPETRIVEDTSTEPAESSLGPTRGPLSGYRLWHDLGWVPQYDLAAGLTDYVRWRQESGFLD
ncbi:MAG: NAD(P)-dependent oxidoreductase [Chloroflexota bacterium]|nr:NAD(P)-dependent oxidoreductase [Chloroflexota bacterium]MDE2958474.1 NAD(P)-dependent oxidoreductase [Chloroflexota bacterium]